MTSGEIVDFAQERRDVETEIHFRELDKAFGEFDRTAATLAGSDETLRRVLVAAMRDAWSRGYMLPMQERWDAWEVLRARYARPQVRQERCGSAIR